jgi:hypothetical protein
LGQLVRGLGREVEETALTAAERLRDEGRAEGRAEGQAQLLLKLLALRFGTLPPEVSTRVTAASAEELSRLAERVLQAPTLDDVF